MAQWSDRVHHEACEDASGDEHDDEPGAEWDGDSAGPNNIVISNLLQLE